jgi:hypothetical protein
MDVLFVGTMLLQTECGKKIYIEGSLCVPEMGDLTLISPKQLFHGNGIRTEFNDIRRLTLPSGDIVKFTETNKSYILKIRTDHSTPSFSGPRRSSLLLPLRLQLSRASRQISSIAAAAISPLIASAPRCTL